VTLAVKVALEQKARREAAQRQRLEEEGKAAA
jgi:hypothetical protein